MTFNVPIIIYREKTMQFNFKHILLILTLSSYCQTLSADELKVEHIANAGVKISSAGQVVLIDALFGPHKRFNFLNEEDFNKLTKEGADIALATHIHADHFGIKRTAAFLDKNPQTLFIGTPQILTSLEGEVTSAQLVSEVLTDFQSTRFTHNDIKVSVLNFPHMGFDNHQKTQNYAYIVEVNGWKVLHVGDADVNADVIQGHNLADANIDIALIHDLFPVKKENYVDLLKLMNVKKVAFIHMTDNKADSLEKWLKKNIPKATMLVTGHEEVVLKR